MEFVMDFEKPSISKNVAKFLEDNLKTEKEQESLTNVIAGKTVLKIDAITLLITILKALTNNDALEDEEFSATIPTEEGDNGEKEELPKKVTEVLAIDKSLDEFPTLAQSMVKWTLAEGKGKKQSSSQYFLSYRKCLGALINWSRQSFKTKQS